jgi:drug/metabolite transporter (DMT)-like permease
MAIGLPMMGAMRQRDVAELVALAALWGASFLFMRLGAGEFGPVALAGVRVLVASACLAPLVVSQDLLPALRAHWRPIVLVGVLNSALPFLAYSYAALSITAGLASIFNATTPLWGALVAWLWLRERPTGSRLAGLAIGFAGVAWLGWSNVNQAASFKPGGNGWAVLACLGATLLYGVAASYTKRRLAGIAPLAVAAGSQIGASALLAPLAFALWPAEPPGALAWAAVLMLGVLSTAMAYVLYFRLIAHAGPANAMAVTFLIPAFAVLWGWLFLGETITAVMAVGCAVILVGTALATGQLTLARMAWRRRAAP